MVGLIVCSVPLTARSCRDGTNNDIINFSVAKSKPKHITMLHICATSICNFL